ncbi:MAG: hypothetical protein IJ641_05650, partial [Lachnospiraceae bacterium]|nr:hypothetical protein [Lachnospiraceae bacterium]
EDSSSDDSDGDSTDSTEDIGVQDPLETVDVDAGVISDVLAETAAANIVNMPTTGSVKAGGADNIQAVSGEALDEDELVSGVAGERMAPRKEPGAATATASAMIGDMTEEGAKISFWWSLIILLLGATGKEMYNRHQQKVAAKNREEDEKR